MQLKEPNTLKVRLNRVKLQREVKPVKVFLTGDWHISPIISNRQYNFLKDALEKTQPDIIILQGDLMDSPVELGRETSLKKLMRELKLCSKTAPTFMVIGNHDYITPVKPVKVRTEFAIPRYKILCEKCGVKLLLDEWAELDNIRIFGSLLNPEAIVRTIKSGKRQGELTYKENPAAYEKKLEKFDFSNLQPDKINWFAAHAPLLTPSIVERCQGFDIMSFGHTHGGLVPKGLDEAFDKLGVNAGLYSAKNTLFPRKVRGMWQEPTDTFVVVNSGMVGAQFCAPRVTQSMNFLKAAEVNLVEITGSKD